MAREGRTRGGREGQHALPSNRHRAPHGEGGAAGGEGLGHKGGGVRDGGRSSGRLYREAYADWRELAPLGANQKAAPPPARGPRTLVLTVGLLHLFPAGLGMALSCVPTHIQFGWVSASSLVFLRVCLKKKKQKFTNGEDKRLKTVKTKEITEKAEASWI